MDLARQNREILARGERGDAGAVTLCAVSSIDRSPLVSPALRIESASLTEGRGISRVGMLQGGRKSLPRLSCVTAYALGRRWTVRRAFILVLSPVSHS